ncbi:MAG: exodeoxyribonuclease VII large subunit [Candidatus Binatus sp.]
MEGQLDLSLRGHRAGLITVSDLVRMVRDALDATLSECWVVGEISNARLAPSNHFYFTLKDARSALNVVMFKTAFNRVRFKPVDGMEVIVRGRVQVFEQRGALQLYADEMEPRGVGALQVAFEQLKRRLEAEGLFDRSRKRAMPYLPRRIGIVTARGGAGLRDMLRILFDRFPSLHVIFRAARVQGDGAAREIADAIADLNRDGRAEVLIVGRGGGSLEDLWAFNEEIVARAIFRSAIPVISAVGHEVDYTIADFVADLRAPTPTAAAQMVVPSLVELKERVESLGASLASVMERELSGRRESVDDLAERIRHPDGIIAEARERVAAVESELTDAVSSRIADQRRIVRELRLRLRSPDAAVREMRLRTARLGGTLVHGVRSALEAKRRQLGAQAGMLDALSPLKVLDRGYAVVINKRDSRAVLDAATVKLEDELDIRLARGRISARAISRSIQK